MENVQTDLSQQNGFDNSGEQISISEFTTSVSVSQEQNTEAAVGTDSP